MNEYVALLRGINVGGKNLIKMIDLKLCLEDAGFKDVHTYIQSGNVLFSAAGSDQVKLTKEIEDALSKTFTYESRVVVRSRKQMKDIVTHAPKGFGSDPATYHYDVIFLKEPLSAAKAMKSVATKEESTRPLPGKVCFIFQDSAAARPRV